MNTMLWLALAVIVILLVALYFVTILFQQEKEAKDFWLGTYNETHKQLLDAWELNAMYTRKMVMLQQKQREEGVDALDFEIALAECQELYKRTVIGQKGDGKKQ